MNRLLRNLTLGVVCSGLGLWLACDSATPTAPSGTVLTITANPSQIGLSGTSQITVIGRRPDGNPLNPGTEVFFSTSRGTITPTVTTVDDAGIATAVLRGDGRAGAANVTASVSTSSGGGGGGGEGGEGGGGPTTGIGSVSTTVQIGNDPEDRPTVIISASPSTLFVEQSSEITIVVRNSDGSPFPAGQRVILTSTLGTLNPSRPMIGNDGTATATLNAGSQPGTAEITAIVGSSEPAMTSVTIQDTVTDISIVVNPDSVPSGGGSVEVTAFAVNSQGDPVPGRQVIFDTDLGTFDEDVVFTSNQGIATTTLTVTQAQLSSYPASERTFTVSAQTGSGSTGELESAAIEVVIEGR